jgi:HTH-type transcriptional regulator/antitoxin HigA
MTQLRHAGPFTNQKVIYFAAKLKIAPGILVGRLQHEKLLPQSYLNGLKRRFDFKEPA